ncbi:MAG TPA: hypothetical protein VMX54_18355 [Vicinamibacteria bacterium]|nr:hypothetical protein [Vicinamibacteria bacterium]
MPAAASVLLVLALAGPPPASPQAPALVQRDKASGLEVRFVPFPWRPDVFQTFDQGGETARSWAFARLSLSGYFALDGTRLFPGQYALVLNPKTGALPMTLELRRVAGREFLVDPPAMAAPPPGETVYKRPVEFAAGGEMAPVLDLTVASWNEGSLLTVRWGDRKLVKELPRAEGP